MGILIGMDEAGYGPNFGPLVVAASAWEVPEQGCSGIQRPQHGEALAHAEGGRGSGVATAARPVKRRRREDSVDLYRLLRSVVAKSASERRIAIADSKVLYHPGLGLRQLERGVHTALLMMQKAVPCWSAIVRHCDADSDAHHRRVCWPDGFDCALPVDASADELRRLATRLARACDGCGIRPLALRAKLIYPETFNELVAYHGTKGAALSHVTVGLLRELLDLLATRSEAAGALSSAFRGSPSVYAVCDKHGGRNYYTSLLQHHFSEHWIRPVYESHEESRYEWGQPDSPVRVTFRMKGETFMPTALASMTAKYFRELAMRAFNEFWSIHVPGLKPTAGYPSDSQRFRDAIRSAQRKLGIDDHVLWRNR